METHSDKKTKSLTESIEDIFMAATYAEADDLKDLRNTLKCDMELVHPHECQYGDNELCCHES